MNGIRALPIGVDRDVISDAERNLSHVSLPECQAAGYPTFSGPAIRVARRRGVLTATTPGQR